MIFLVCLSLQRLLLILEDNPQQCGSTIQMSRKMGAFWTKRLFVTFAEHGSLSPVMGAGVAAIRLETAIEAFTGADTNLYTVSAPCQYALRALPALSDFLADRRENVPACKGRSEASGHGGPSVHAPGPCSTNRLGL